MRTNLIVAVCLVSGLLVGCNGRSDSPEPAPADAERRPALPESSDPTVETLQPGTQPTGPEDPAVAGMGLEARRIYWRINEARRKRGLEMLEVRGDLKALAREHNRGMLRTRVLSHRSGAGDVGQRLSAVGIAWNYVAETVARFGATDDPARRALELWQASDADRKNLLDNVYREIGVSARKDPKTGLWYVTAILCRRNLRYQDDPPAEASGPPGR
jgi:uncharacterized protein YkwD